MSASNLKPYPNFIQIELPWLKRIPKDWRLSKFKIFYDCSMGATILATDLIEGGHIPVFSATEDERLFGYVNQSRVLLDKGDLVIPARGTIGSPKLVESLSTCTQTTIYAKIKKQINPRFVFYFLIGCRDYLFNYVQTAIPQITVNEVKNNPLIVPSEEEQKEISGYLDSKCHKIESTINGLQSMIEKLNEKRSAVIIHAVTKGLNPDVKMNDSGVDWLGKIPSHWDMSPLKFFCMFQRGHDLPSDLRINGSIPVVSSGGISGWHNRSKAKPPGIVTGRYGSIGVFYFIEQDYWPLDRKSVV